MVEKSGRYWEYNVDIMDILRIYLGYSDGIKGVPLGYNADDNGL